MHAVQETGPPTPLLDTVNYPVHLKNLGLGDLKKLCKELRAGGRRVEAAQLLAPVRACSTPGPPRLAGNRT